MSGGVPAWMAALKRSVLAAPAGSSSKLRVSPFQTTTGPLAAGLAASAGFEAAAGAAVGFASAAGAAGLVSAGFDSAGLAVGAAGVDDEHAASIEAPAVPASTPRKPRREKMRSDAMDLSLPQWSVRGI